MKGHILHAATVHLRLCPGQPGKDRLAGALCSRIDPTRVYEIDDIPVVPVIVGCLRHIYTHPEPGYGVALLAPHPDRKAVQTELVELGTEALARYPKIEERSKSHVSAYAGEAIEVSDQFGLLSGHFVPLCLCPFVPQSPDHARLIRLATYPAPNPLSMLTTVTPEAQELSMPSSAEIPPKLAP